MGTKCRDEGIEFAGDLPPLPRGRLLETLAETEQQAPVARGEVAPAGFYEAGERAPARLRGDPGADGGSGAGWGRNHGPCNGSRSGRSPATVSAQATVSQVLRERVGHFPSEYGRG